MKPESITLDVELSTHCNLKCPQCSRTDEDNKLKPYSFLKPTSVSLSKFKRWFPPTAMEAVNFHFSGTFGDPGMCKDLKEIVCYIIDESNCTISINTNGSMRDEQFWWDIASYSGKRLKIIFDVDGINQEMHGFYRRGSDLEKVLTALEVTSATLARVSVLTVLFKHNQDYLEDIRDMCRKRAFSDIEFDAVEGNNFQKGSTYPFVNEDGNKEVLEQITREDREQGLERNDRRVRDHRHPIGVDITCLAKEQNNMKVTVEGQISPCCYLSTPLRRANEITDGYITDDGVWNGNLNKTMKEFVDNKNDFNLNHKSLQSIINNDWFTVKLPKSWKDQTACFACKKVCGRISYETR